MRRYGFKYALTVRNGVDLEHYAPLPQAKEPRLTFIGSLDWRPNQDALRWFLGEIWPLVRSGISDVEMTVVGRRPPRWIAGLCEANDVRLHADAPDVRPHLADASAVVVPLRIGGGSRLKILEAMAAGRCVVSTSIGAEGLEVRHGEHLSIADTPAGFAEATLSLVGDARDHRALRQSLARAGRALVEAEYGWDRIALDLEEAWRSCYDTHTAAGLQRSDGSAGAARQHS
jgi:glycosyltransferase involved in cell wall biosynthesis